MKIKIINLLGAFVVLSLIILPALSQPEPGLRSCACQPDDHDCTGSSIESCCSKSKSQDSCISSGCACLIGQLASYPEREYYNCGCSYFSKSGTRSPARNGPVGLAGSNNSGLAPLMFPVAPASAGPPDMDIVEYLPPSARQVFHVLASEGPLTQKDIIGRTDLPPRTVRYALERLRGEEMLEERFCFRDARQSLYCLIGFEAR